MPFTGIAHLATLTRALEDYCHANDISAHSPERDEAARVVISMFQKGWHTADELEIALATVAKDSLSRPAGGRGSRRR
jgi:hypothetical protein